MHQTVFKYALKHSLKGKGQPRTGYEGTDRK